MTAVWLLTTRARPEACQAVLDACEATGMTSQGLVYVDETVDEYRNIRLPANWKIHYEPEWGSIAKSMRYTRKRFPKATQYGWLADDQYPRSHQWDRKLEHAAGDWHGVTVEHVTWKIGKREKDENDEWERRGLSLIATDLAKYEEWAVTKREAVCDRIRLAMAA